MENAMGIYFGGEKNAGVVLAALGIIGLAAAAFFWPARWSLRSFAVTLAIFAVIEIGIGVGLYLRTNPQVAGLLAQLESNAAAFFTDEGARMAKVQRNFVVVQYIEVAVVLLAAIVALVAKHRPTISGIALGVLLNAALLLAFDIIAERRGAVYVAAIASSGSFVPR